MNLLKNKVILVSGGTRGIGYEVCELAAQSGAIVVAGARSKVEFQNQNIEYYNLDVTSPESCKVFFDYAIQKYEKIDGLVCDAGITSDSMTAKMTDEAFNTVIDTNLKGTFNLVRLVGPYMENQGKGSIVNIASIVGEYGNIGQANYAASKAGIIGMSKSWAKEFARKGKPVRVNSICPGYILTEMLKSVPENLLEKFAEQTMLKRLGQPEEIASAVLFLLSEMSSYITGSVIDANGGMRL